MTIRPANKDELRTVVDVLRRSYATVARRFGLTAENYTRNPAFCAEQRVREDLDRGLQYYALEEGARVCGCVALGKAHPDVCCLRRLAVIPEHRSKGFGRARVRHVLAEAETRGARRVDIGIVAEDTQLKDWYRQFGFVQIGTKTFDHLPFVMAFMAKELDYGRGSRRYSMH